MERFWSKVDKRGPDDCWEWTGSLASGGYGTGIRVHGRRLLSHRMAWELAFGPIPVGLCVCHTCDNRVCCNPAHLWLGTHADNNHDRDRKGRGRGAAGERNRHSKLTRAQVGEIRARYKPGWGERKKLAAEFGITGEMVYQIVSGRCWKGV